MNFCVILGSFRNCGFHLNCFKWGKQKQKLYVWLIYKLSWNSKHCNFNFHFNVINFDWNVFHIIIKMWSFLVFSNKNERNCNFNLHFPSNDLQMSQIRIKTKPTENPHILIFPSDLRSLQHLYILIYLMDYQCFIRTQKVHSYNTLWRQRSLIIAH